MFQCESVLDHPKLWTENFGPLNFAVDIGNVSLVGLATPIMQDKFCGKESHKAAQQNAVNFVQSYRPEKLRMILNFSICSYSLLLLCF
jgi:hypothetical protein